MLKTCEKCGNEYENVTTAKRKYCYDCSPRQLYTKKHTYICAKCGETFENTQERKQCFKCCRKFKLWNREDCEKAANKCTRYVEFIEKYQPQYDHARQQGFLEEITGHLIKETQHTAEECMEVAMKCKTSGEFQTKYPSYYGKASRLGLLPEIARVKGRLWNTKGRCLYKRNCTQCGEYFETKYSSRIRCEACGTKRRSVINQEMCKKAALNCKTRTEFQRNYSTEYQRSRKNGWLDDICTHMESGFSVAERSSLTQFKHTCERYDNYGTLYLIKASDFDETFYKIGITGLQSAKNRFTYGGRIPYCYQIVWEVQGDPTVIWELEIEYKRLIKKLGYHYLPKVPFGGSLTECFKCHGNCKILRFPVLT